MDANQLETTPEAPASARAARAPRISVVVPTRNEARNLPHVLGQLPADLHQVILVDGHSVDDTVEVARRVRPDIEIVHQTRKGKGNAMACGFARVTGDVVVMLDADGSADPAEIPAFVAALVDGADFAKGTRFAAGGGSHDITPIRRLGNAGLNGLVNVLFGTRYSDLCYGYNVFWASLLEVLDLPALDIPGLPAGQGVWGDGFEIETLINVRVAAAGARITEVGSVELSRLHGESNLNAVTDGLRVLRTILAERRRVATARRTARQAARQAARSNRPVVLRASGRAAAVTTGSGRVPKQGGPATIPTGVPVTDLTAQSLDRGLTAAFSTSRR
jgi:glycosyltransferase involved in cell wall biosynthesis